MKRVLRWILRGLAAVAVVVVFVGAFAASEAMIRWPQPKAKVELVASRDAGTVVRGKRLATVYDCHGAAPEGRLFHDEPAVVRVSGPNLSERAPHHLLRTGLAAGNRKLGLMSEVAPVRLNELSHEASARCTPT
ncbi:MAG TPA: hypothetical protein VK634_02695 [Reyranella sp.]|nr:hypothetical protein [Reyranella sp.]